MKLLTLSDLVSRLPSMRDEPDKVRRLFVDESGKRIAKLIGATAEVAAIGDSEDRTVEFVISTGSLDRYNSTIAVDGWQTDNFAQNPVVLWAHDDSIPAIARAEQTQTSGGKLKSRAVFADRDTHPLADTVFRLIKGRFINGSSVGWIPLKWQFVEEEGRGFGVDYLEQELLEWSVVNIPANPECLVGARSLGIDTKPLIVWAERTLDQAGSLLIPRAELEALRKAAGAPSVSRPARATRDDGADWKCGAARDLPIADDDSWDGPAAEKAIFAAYGFDGDKPDTAAAAKCFLACDDSAPEKRGSYKLPFAKMVDGKPKASAAGIRAAASRLPDTDIPQSVKDEARKVLDAYEAKMKGDDDKSFAASAAALQVLLVNGVLSAGEFVGRVLHIAGQVRAGKVLSQENEDALAAAHDCMSKAADCMRKAADHCTTAADHHDKACEHVRGIIERSKKKPDDSDPDDDDNDPEQPSGDNDDDDAARALRARRARVLRLKDSTSTLALATAANAA